MVATAVEPEHVHITTARAAVGDVGLDDGEHLVGRAGRERRVEELRVDDGADGRRGIGLHNLGDIFVAMSTLGCGDGGKVVGADQSHLREVGHKMLLGGAVDGLEAGEVGRG